MVHAELLLRLPGGTGQRRQASRDAHFNRYQRASARPDCPDRPDLRQSLGFGLAGGGHHNVRTDSAKYHDKDWLRRGLLPALERNHVDFYLAGHSHNLQLIEYPDEPVYVIAGGGGKHPRPLIKPDKHSLLAKRDLGFVKLSFGPTKANISFTATSGFLYSTFSVHHYRFEVLRACLSMVNHANCIKPLH